MLADSSTPRIEPFRRSARNDGTGRTSLLDERRRGSLAPRPAMPDMFGSTDGRGHHPCSGPYLIDRLGACDGNGILHDLYGGRIDEHRRTLAGAMRPLPGNSPILISPEIRQSPKGRTFISDSGNSLPCLVNRPIAACAASNRSSSLILFFKTFAGCSHPSDVHAGTIGARFSPPVL